MNDIINIISTIFSLKLTIHYCRYKKRPQRVRCQVKISRMGMISKFRTSLCLPCNLKAQVCPRPRPVPNHLMTLTLKTNRKKNASKSSAGSSKDLHDDDYVTIGFLKTYVMDIISDKLGNEGLEANKNIKEVHYFKTNI